jgi:C1A family cysteine protease
LATVGASTSFSGDVVVELDGDAIVLEGLGTTVTNLARAMRLAASAENAWAAYQLSFDLVPPTLQAALPTPASLSGKPLSQINAALQELEAQLATVANLAQTHAEATPAAPGPHELTAQSAGTGIDTDAACAAPSGYVASIWFPLKSFVSPVRNQSRRGTCWAFTAIGALESRELVQNGNAVNLSEQFLVNKVKNDWAEADYSEGYDAVTALNLAVANGQGLPSESSWTYNGAPNRTSNGDGAAADYVGTCNPYGQGPNAGWCSETAHQSPQYCTTVVFTFCGYKTIQFSGGIAASNASQIWASGQPFLKNNYINLLAQGQLIMASFPVYEGFMSAEKGIVTNYDKKRLDDKNNLVDGAYGNHAVQIVAFLSNQQLSTPSYAANGGGGGYFVVKNSWGCGAGDGGYWYVPADYVWRRFNSLSVLQMGSQRSAAWKREQADPGSAEAPTVGIKSANATIDLRVPTDLTNYFGVSHSVATSVQLTVASSKDGTLYSGAWNTAPYTFPVPLTRTFASAGARTITVTATYAGNVTRKSFTANVVNTAPALSLSGSGTAYVGDPYFLTALVSDINDSGTAGLCAATTWQVTAPDTLTPASGCQVTATFAAEGTRTVSATTRDADGLTSTRSLTLNVRPQSESPFPKVTAFGVYSRQFTSLGGLPFCSNVSVATGATIDFRQDGCVVTGPAPKRYSASVEVENPSNEALTYAWLTEVYYSGAWHAINSPAATPDATFVPYSIGNTGLTTAPCRIGVRVNAPEPTRSKSLTVWSGSCTYYTTRLN